MNKKKIISLALSILVILPSAAFAKGKDNNDGKSEKEHKVIEQKQTTVQSTQGSQHTNVDKDKEKGEDKKGEVKKEDAQEKKDEKKQQIEAFKTAMKDKHAQMKALQAQIAEQRTLVNQKKAQLSAIIDELKAGTKTLPADQLNALLQASLNLVSDGEEVKTTSTVSSDVNQTQDSVKKSDFNNALASMDKVLGKLQKRLDALKQLNADLDTMLKIANLATAPAPATTPEPSGTTTNSNTTTTQPADTNTNTTNQPTTDTTTQSQTTTTSGTTTEQTTTTTTAQ